MPLRKPIKIVRDFEIVGYYFVKNKNDDFPKSLECIINASSFAIHPILKKCSQSEDGIIEITLVSADDWSKITGRIDPIRLHKSFLEDALSVFYHQLLDELLDFMHSEYVRI